MPQTTFEATLTRKLIAIDLACNDPDNGNEIGQVRALEIADGALEFDGRIFGRPLRLVENANDFRMAGKTWPFEYMKAWYGNWCWNRYWLKRDVAIAFTRWIKRRGLFTEPHCGDEKLFNWWKSEIEVSDDWLIRRFVTWQNGDVFAEAT